MADDEQWERPIGLTKEYAICVDESDDDAESLRCHNRGSSDGDQSKVVSQKCASSLSHGESRIGNAISSYFQKGSASHRVSEDGDLEKDKVTIGTVDENEPPMMKDNAAVAKFDNSPTEPSSSKEDAVEDVNPFASFAFAAEEALSSSSSWRPIKRPRENSSTSKPAHQKPTKKKKNMKEVKQQTKPKAKSHSFLSKTPSAKNTIDTRPAGSWQLTRSEMADAQQQKKTERKQQRKELISKWHAFADPKVPIEQQRFQLLVAARLHARCQEQVVAKSMDRLRKYFDDKHNLDNTCCDVDAQRGEQPRISTGESLNKSTTQLQSQTTPMGQKTSCHAPGLTVHSLAKATPETEIAPLLSSVLFGNTKASQVVQAAQDIISKFGGKVPESMSGLKEITGIGPKLAEILSIVNKRETYL